MKSLIVLLVILAQCANSFQHIRFAVKYYEDFERTQLFMVDTLISVHLKEKNKTLEFKASKMGPYSDIFSLDKYTKYFNILDVDQVKIKLLPAPRVVQECKRIKELGKECYVAVNYVEFKVMGEYSDVYFINTFNAGDNYRLRINETMVLRNSTKWSWRN